MKVFLFTNDSACTDIVEVKAAHICMFGKANEIDIRFVIDAEQMKFIQACIKHYVLIKIQGSTVTIVPEEYQRVRFRFES